MSSSYSTPAGVGPISHKLDKDIISGVNAGFMFGVNLVTGSHKPGIY